MRNLLASLFLAALTSGAIAQGAPNAGAPMVPNATPGASGTVTSVSVATANGFSGSSSGGATPAITLKTTVTGILLGNGTSGGVGPATAGTDYVAPGGALGTPSSGTLTNATGLPIAGLTGLGTNVASALGQPLNGSASALPSQIIGNWTPADVSGATLVFTNVNVGYSQIGNMVYVYGTLRYPATADTSAATIGGLPITVAAASYGEVPGAVSQQVTLAFPVITLSNNNTKTFGFYNQFTQAAVTNIQLSNSYVTFSFFYPVN